MVMSGTDVITWRANEKRAIDIGLGLSQYLIANIKDLVEEE